MATLNIGIDLKNYIINLIKSTVRDVYYPVGKIYVTIGGEDPNKTIGGTWTKISGGYLWGCNSSIDNNLMPASSGSTKSFTDGGGTSGSTTLTINQMPTHNHTFYYSTSSSGYASGQTVAARSSASNDIQKNGDYTFYSWTQKSGGGKGHDHSIPNHSHDIPYIGVWVWKRTK